MKCTACGAWTRATPRRLAPTACRTVTSPPTRCRRLPPASPPDWLSLSLLPLCIPPSATQPNQTLGEPEGLGWWTFSDSTEWLLSLNHLASKHWALTLRLNDLILLLLDSHFNPAGFHLWCQTEQTDKSLFFCFFFKSCLNYQQICPRPIF